MSPRSGGNTFSKLNAEINLLSPQKGVGSVAVPASCSAVQHEGEKHQEGPDTHPENQPEPRASGEKSKQFSLSFFALVNKLLTHTCARTTHFHSVF